MGTSTSRICARASIASRSNRIGTRFLQPIPRKIALRLPLSSGAGENEGPWLDRKDESSRGLRFRSEG